MSLVTTLETEFDILHVPLFENRRFWLTRDPFIQIWDLIKEISNLDLTNGYLDLEGARIRDFPKYRSLSSNQL
jgi:hypothetical protein